MSKSKDLNDVVNDQIEKITGKKPVVFNPKKLEEARETFIEAKKRWAQIYGSSNDD